MRHDALKPPKPVFAPERQAPKGTAPAKGGGSACSSTPNRDRGRGASTSLHNARAGRRPGWRPTLVRADTFRALQVIQASTSDPVLDLSYLSDACIALALDLGPEQIVKRALELMRPLREASSS